MKQYFYYQALPPLKISQETNIFIKILFKTYLVTINNCTIKTLKQLNKTLILKNLKALKAFV